MTINSNVSSNGDLMVSIDGRFDFTCQDDFKATYQDTNADKEINKVTIDLTNTESVDSSALGMLLMMREHLGGTHAKIALVNCSTVIKEALSTANFKMLFKIV